MCLELFSKKEYICPNCINKIKYCIEPSFIGEEKYCVHSLSYYAGLTEKLIINLKYKNDFNAGRFLGRFTYLKFKDIIDEADLLIPAPTSAKSFAKRGYNQSLVICKEIQQLSGIKTLDILKKSDKTKDQIGLSFKERWDNMEGAIKLKVKRVNLKHDRAILIDDVFTTGATSYNCAFMLNKIGIKNINIITMAKGGV